MVSSKEYLKVLTIVRSLPAEAKIEFLNYLLVLRDTEDSREPPSSLPDSYS